MKHIHTQIVDFSRKKYADNKAKARSVGDNLKLIKDDLGFFLRKIIDRDPMIITNFVYVNKDSFHQSMDVTSDEAVLGTTLDAQG